MNVILWAQTAAVILGIYYIVVYLERALRRRLLLKHTYVLDNDTLGRRLPSQKIKGAAVVCGGSIAGLIAARACHDHFEEVVIVEPEARLSSQDAKRTDVWNQENKRTRIMQYDSIHSFLAAGYMSLTKLFLNLAEECKSLSVRIGPNDQQAHMWGREVISPFKQYGGSLPKTLYLGRRGLETLLRHPVLSGDYKSIRQVIGTVIGISRDVSDPHFIDRVMIRTPEGAMTDIPAALIVDCTGPVAAGLKWLRREGYGVGNTYAKNELPLDRLKISYDQKLHYSTLLLHIPPELGRKLPGFPGPYDECGMIYAFIPDTNEENRCIYSQRIEGDYSSESASELPKTLEEAKVWARTLVTEVPIPEGWYAMLDMLKEVQDTMACSQVRFGKVDASLLSRGVNLPSNWIAAGDCVMRVNPIFGHGCSKAIGGAVCLNKLLQTVPVSIPKDFSKKYFQMHADKIEPICLRTHAWHHNHEYDKNHWYRLLIPDYGFPTTVPVPGETLSEGAWLRWYIKKLTDLAFTDAQAASALWHIRVLLAPPTDLMQLSLVLKVVWNLIRCPCF
ncbi:hypothetical protein EDD18DRAFT_1431988 [Armillaria luteobubalina]|uniref:FAD dependent oxidoreductase domain-containing protein n=1 Tax=Armillaria luteobubalina TaxID=153913 RepID=A0AA39QH56_9AGAR|nr:hypothetical protein EDD18DRAFT_1431988 [Armillaria luteobubalina]